MEHHLKIVEIQSITHNVRRYRLEKPEGFRFEPGQATEVSIDKDEWRDEKRPFTFTCLNDDPFLEFTIKSYHDHNGVTNELSKLVVGDKLIVRDVWGTIQYKGPGYFIAGGAGITPFIAILRQLHKDNKLEGNKLYFSNQTSKDIILQNELTAMLGDNAHYLVTKEPGTQYDNRRIDEAFLKAEIPDFNKHFYVCGPDKMISDIREILERLGADVGAVVFEK